MKIKAIFYQLDETYVMSCCRTADNVQLILCERT